MAQLPGQFTVNRMVWTFWATESVLSSAGYYGKVERRPAWFAIEYSLYTEDVGYVGFAREGLCFPWQDCNFEVFDCDGSLLYTTQRKKLQGATQQTASQVVDAFEFANAEGAYIGRTSQIQGEGLKLGGIKLNDEMTIMDTGDSDVAVLQHDSSQWFIMTWDCQINMPDLNGFANTVSTPLSDPRIIIMFVAMRFRGTGVFSPVVFCLLIALLIAACVLAVKKYRRWKLNRDIEWDFLGGNNEDEQQAGSLLNGNCCTGNRGKY